MSSKFLALSFVNLSRSRTPSQQNHKTFFYCSDARVAAPLVKSATIHGEHGNIGNTFLYVFQHVTKYGYYPEVRKKDLN